MYTYECKQSTNIRLFDDTCDLLSGLLCHQIRQRERLIIRERCVSESSPFPMPGVNPRAIPAGTTAIQADICQLYAEIRLFYRDLVAVYDDVINELNTAFGELNICVYKRLKTKLS